MYTPGPWKYKVIEPPYGTVNYFEIWADHYENPPANLLATSSGRGYIDNERAEANVRLLAAAPDLLEALESLFENCQMIHTHWGENCNQREADAAIAAAHAAIAKARGL